mmetsp:Transcript_18264/g.17393  ORF Transcript_18264/g.17393 Transcript_18264/m.17393 type:complete len:341 (-) Transcript_18264:630-1652(-)
MISIMILTYQIDQLLTKFKINSIITPHFFTILLGLILGLIAHFFYDEDSLNQIRDSQPMMLQVFLVPPILFEIVYSMRKERVILDRLGTLVIFALVPFILKMAITTVFTHHLIFPYAKDFLPGFYECLLYSISVYASDSLNIVTKLGEIGFSQNDIVFIHSGSVLGSIFVILFAKSINAKWVFHGILSDIALTLFANTFFTCMIGISMAFFTSYCLKSNYETLATTFDNFDIMMMIMAPVVSYLIAESLNISGILSIVCCGYVLSIYAQPNLHAERAHLLKYCFRAMAYFSRTICDFLVGLGFGIYLQKLLHAKLIVVIPCVIFTIALDFLGSWLMCKLL